MGLENIEHNSEYIKISDVSVSDNKLAVKLDLSRNVGRYFFKRDFVVNYDRNIEDVDGSILAIPPLLATAPVAWAAGADVYVDSVDKNCLLSLEKVRRVFQEMFPKFSSKGKICASNTVTNTFGSKQKALLFSGGVDSLASYVRHKEDRPTLITMLRGERGSPAYKYWDKVKNTFHKFAAAEGVGIHFVRTDLWDSKSDILNNKLLATTYGIKGGWWDIVSHGLILLGLSAPLTPKDIGTIMLAPAYDRGHQAIHGSQYLTNLDFSWANVKVHLDADETTRHAKIKNVLRRNPSYLKYLRVCLYFASQPMTGSDTYVKNCGLCEKCLRTATSLILEGIDPRTCNFDINYDVLDHLKHLIVNCLFPVKPSALYLWREIQNIDCIADNEVSKRYNSKQFFEWLKDFDLSNYRYDHSRLSKSYHSLKHGGFHYARRVITKYISRRLR